MRLALFLVATLAAAAASSTAAAQELPAVPVATDAPAASVSKPQLVGPTVGFALLAEKPKLTMFTLNNVAFGGGLTQAAIAGAAAGAIARTDSATPVTADDLEDPAQALGAALAEAYAAKKGGHAAASAIILHKGGPAPDVSGAAYVVYVETVAWGAYYLALDWTHFHVQYAVKFHIVDTANGKDVAKASCRKFAKNPGKPPSFQELNAEKGAVMKSLLASASDECLRDFKAAI